MGLRRIRRPGTGRVSLLIQRLTDTRHQLADNVERLRDVVQTALDEPGAVVNSWDVARLSGAFEAQAPASLLYLVSGAATLGQAERPWRVVLKVLAPVTSHADPGAIDYPKRETLLYSSGALDSLASGLVAPRCHGYDERPDGAGWLWLEYVQVEDDGVWPRARWALAARHLGQFNGAYLTGRPIPRAPWLGARRLRTWLERREPLVARISAAALDPQVSRWWPRSIVDAILGLWAERDTYCDALDRLPQTFCHGDAIRRNLLSRRRPDGTAETVAIDWEYAGYYAAGEEVGQTLSVASAFFDLNPADLPTLDEELFASYLAGLGEAGWRGDPRPVRFAYCAHAALRNLVNAVGTIVPGEAERPGIIRNHGHSWEELAERRAEIRPFLLELADEARRMLAAGLPSV
jgi:hypothetical protein